MASQVVSIALIREWFPGESDTDLTTGHIAAESYVASRCQWVPDADGHAPGDLVQAVRLLVARYLARRNSPDGFVGMSEFGPARIATVDRDIESLIAPYRRVVFG